MCKRTLAWFAILSTVPAACGDTDAPTGPLNGSAFTALTAGEDHTCALAAAGTVFCWGLNRNGQLGDGSTVDRFEPVRVVSDEESVAVSAGNSHTCAVSTSGDLFCWGRNTEGQLGDGTATDRPVPVPVDGGQGFLLVTGGGTHTCGLNSVSAFCWGSSQLGQLGTGTSGVNAGKPNPTPVQTTLEFAALTAGGLHTCGRTVAGSAYCWGSDLYGQLGTADAERCDDGLGNPTACSPTPVRVSRDQRFTALRAGVGHTCGLNVAGAMLCWGRNFDGQLGTGGREVHTTPAPVTGDHQFVSIATGLGHTCGLDPSGHVYCWGLNHRGQLGDGTTSDRSVPARVEPGEAGPGSRFTALVAGGVHTCGLAEGVAYCWGSNGFGQLGNPAAGDTCSGGPCSTTPLRVTAPFP